MEKLVYFVWQKIRLWGSQFLLFAGSQLQQQAHVNPLMLVLCLIISESSKVCLVRTQHALLRLPMVGERPAGRHARLCCPPHFDVRTPRDLRSLRSVIEGHTHGFLLRFHSAPFPASPFLVAVLLQFPHPPFTPCCLSAQTETSPPFSCWEDVSEGCKASGATSPHKSLFQCWLKPAGLCVQTCNSGVG